MRLVVIALAVILASAVPFVAASTVSGSCVTGVGAGDPVFDKGTFDQATTICGLYAQNGACTLSAMVPKVGLSNNGGNNQAFFMCSSSAPSTSATGDCCNDQCASRYSQSCTEGTADCILVPGPGTTLQCTMKAKVCALLSQSGNVSDCDRYTFCKYNKDTTTCEFVLPQTPPPVAGESVADKCPALHPVVIAMLVLMFLSFVAGVVVVGVVVFRNQKKADEEDSRREQAEAAAAEAKRARANRNRL